MEDIYEEIHSLDQNRKHLFFTFIALPVKLDPDGFNFKDENTIIKLKNISNNVIYRSPYGGIPSFDNLLREFTYQGNYYQADYLVNSDLLFNFCRTKIHQKGIISITISIDAASLEAIRSSIFFLRDDKKLLNSLCVNTNLLAYLILMWLKLMKSVFSINNFQGRIKSIVNLYSGWDLSLVGNRRVFLGNIINPKSIIDINLDEFEDSNQIFNILQLIIKELLRFFNIDIDRFQEGYELFEETIKEYFDPIFRKKPK